MPETRQGEGEDWFREFQRVNALQAGRARARSSPSGREERRRHARFEVDQASAELYRHGLLSSIGLRARNRGSSAVDLSEGGARLIARERITPGTKVRIRIEMEKFKDAIEATGVVRWCYQNPKRHDEFITGAMFIDLPPAQLKKIAVMRQWFTSPQYRAMREGRQRQKDSGIIFPK